MEELKRYTLADDKGPKQLLLRAKEGVLLQPYTAPFSRDSLLADLRETLIQTASGHLLIAASEKKLVVRPADP